MDFSFVRGSEFKQVKGGITITSIDEYNCYLIIIDRATPYTWIFLQSSKDPPLVSIKLILTKFKSTHPIVLSVPIKEASSDVVQRLGWSLQPMI